MHIKNVTWKIENFVRISTADFIEDFFCCLCRLWMNWKFLILKRKRHSNERSMKFDSESSELSLHSDVCTIEHMNGVGWIWIIKNLSKIYKFIWIQNRLDDLQNVSKHSIFFLHSVLMYVIQSHRVLRVVELTRALSDIGALSSSAGGGKFIFFFSW